MQGRSWNGYWQIPALGRDLDLRSRPGLVEAGIGWPWLRHGGNLEEQREVATRQGRRDLVCFGWGETASRHGFDVATWAAVWEVATWISVSRPGSPTMGRNEVATWKRCCDIGEAPGGRDLEK